VVGRHAVDGPFTEFTAALGEPEFGQDGVAYRNLDLRWTGPFTVDGRPAGLDEEPLHLDNPLCRVPFGATELVIGPDGPVR
jgi:hypothetical protein